MNSLQTALKDMAENRELTISFNNEVVNVSSSMTLDMLLKDRGYDARTTMFAVAVNKTFVSKEQYSDTALHDRDEIDVLQPISGG